jgi:hypothetical protein
VPLARQKFSGKEKWATTGVAHFLRRPKLKTWGFSALRLQSLAEIKEVLVINVLRAGNIPLGSLDSLNSSNGGILDW